MAKLPSYVPFYGNPESAPKIFTEEEKHDLVKKREMEDLDLVDRGKAKFKIELLFTAQFSIIKPVPGILSFWESGTKLHGGGDALIHFCPGKTLGRNECEHYIPDPANGYGFLVCPGCHTVWNGKDVFGQILGRFTSQQWAENICKFYRRLDMNCDVVIKYHKLDIRTANRARFAGEALDKVRSADKRLKRIYTLASMQQDLSSGSSLYDRILSFVRA
jgi:hypothetical protein